MYQPTISIIIAVKNAKDLLAETLQSVRTQQYPYLETIVIDGGSTDGTVDVIKSSLDIISDWVSEPDQGISDAFNKGLKKAKGDYIYFQGAGDSFFSPNVINELFCDLDPSFILICGQVMRVEENGVTPVWIAPRSIKPFKACSLLYKMSLPHQGLFTHRAFFEKHGEFNTQMRFAMDYEILLRAYHAFPKTIVKKILIARWRAGGVGTNRISEIFDEYHHIKIQHQVAPLLFLKFIDFFTRLKYLIKAKWLKLAY